jgi:hypothetical protein
VFGDLSKESIPIPIFEEFDKGTVGDEGVQQDRNESTFHNFYVYSGHFS